MNETENKARDQTTHDDIARDADGARVRRRADKRLNASTAQPPGTLRAPYLGRQGDEQRQPSDEEARQLREIQSKQRHDG